MLDNLVGRVLNSTGEKAKEIKEMIDDAQKAYKEMDLLGCAKKIATEERSSLSSISRNPLGIHSKITAEIYSEFI